MIFVKNFFKILIFEEILINLSKDFEDFLNNNSKKIFLPIE